MQNFSRHIYKMFFYTETPSRLVRLVLYMGGTSQDVKTLKMWDFYSLFFGFS